MPVQMVDVSHWQGDFINGYCFGFKVQHDGYCDGGGNLFLVYPSLLLLLQ